MSPRRRHRPTRRRLRQSNSAPQAMEIAAALSLNTAAPAPARIANQNGDAAPPATPARAAPAATDSAASLSAEQLDAAGNGDRAASSPNTAATAPSSVAPDQNGDVAPAAAPTKAAPTEAEAAAALPAEQLAAVGKGDQAASSPNIPVPAPASPATDQNVDTAPPAILARAAPAAADPAAPERVVAALPTLAPVHVILNVPREDSGRGAGARRI